MSERDSKEFGRAFGEAFLSPITNSIAAKFAGAFYRELLRSGDVDQATSNGRLSLYAEPDLPNQAARFEWGIPTLYRHVGAALVWKP